MDNPIPALVFGAFLLAFGGGLLAAEILAGKRRRDEPMEQAERDYFDRRYRRRLQVAGLILLIGVMIPVGDSLIPWRKAPATFAVYLLIVIGLALWSVLLAIGDWASTKVFARGALRRLERQQLELERAAERLRRSSSENNRNGDRPD